MLDLDDSTPVGLIVAEKEEVRVVVLGLFVSIWATICPAVRLTPVVGVLVVVALVGVTGTVTT